MVFLAGPTAVGKSEFAVALAEELNAEIIGADAFQIYAGLGILTAQPSAELRARVPHHLVNCIPLAESFDVVRYVKAARQTAGEILARGKVPLVVGGTGLYFRALMHALDETPPADERLRAELMAHSLEKLQAEYQALDPVGAARIDFQNPRRLVRAIEVCRLSGRPYSSFRRDWSGGNQNSAGAKFRAVFLDRERSVLYARIDQRVEDMFANGVLDEVTRVPGISETAAQTLGYRQVKAVLAGEVAQATAISQIQQATRKYAKRQLTWFRAQPDFRWITLDAAQSTFETVAGITAVFFGENR